MTAGLSYIDLFTGRDLTAHVQYTTRSIAVKLEKKRFLLVSF